MMTSDEIRGFGMGDEFHSTLKMVESVFFGISKLPGVTLWLCQNSY